MNKNISRLLLNYFLHIHVPNTMEWPHNLTIDFFDFFYAIFTSVQGCQPEKSYFSTNLCHFLYFPYFMSFFRKFPYLHRDIFGSFSLFYHFFIIFILTRGQNSLLNKEIPYWLAALSVAVNRREPLMLALETV